MGQEVKNPFKCAFLALFSHSKQQKGRGGGKKGKEKKASKLTFAILKNAFTLVSFGIRFVMSPLLTQIQYWLRNSRL